MVVTGSGTTWLCALVALAASANAFSAPAVQKCHAVSAAASDAWCNENCNHDPPNCPPSLCECTGPPGSPSPSPPAGPPVVGAYHDLSDATGLKGLQALAASAATLPITRLFLAFVSPTLVYVGGSKTLAGTGMGLATTAADAGFSLLVDAIAKLQAGGVEVFLSMGGWNYNCFPALYMRNSIAGYGTHTPNYWKIARYGGPEACTPANQCKPMPVSNTPSQPMARRLLLTPSGVARLAADCYVCEPQSEHTSLDVSFSVFPEPAKARAADARPNLPWLHSAGACSVQ